MKIYEIYNYIYEYVCGDNWFGKASRSEHIGFVADTEENVKSLVDEINAKRWNTRFPKNEPEHEWDMDYKDANYIAYRESEIRVSTFDEIKNHSLCR